MTGPLRGTIVGTGSYAPEKVLSNFDLEKILDTSDEWIVQRTGVRERRVVGDGETSATLGLRAARAALADAGMRAEDLDLVVCATITPDMVCPSTSCFVQENLGITDVPCFDLAAACSGFVYGLSAANGFICSGAYKNILVIGADTLTRITNYEDRSSCILFGDGAGAAVVQATADPDKGLRYFRLGAAGEGWQFIHVPAGGSRTPASLQTVQQRQHYIQMRGRDVYKFAVQKMSYLLRDAMAQCDLEVDDVDLVVPHQVNQRIIESATSKLGFPLDKVYVNIDRYGNTSAASIPLALDEARRSGRVPEGATVVLVAFGAGLTWASGVVTF